MTPTAVAVLALLFAATACPAGAAERVPRWLSSRYGRRGAEIWVEAPRYAFPTGKGYKNEYDFGGGIGFGFGVMFAFSDKLALEGRMVQTTHRTASDDRLWDIDQAVVGLRYGFRYERALQPYVGAGGARVSLEWDPEDNQVTEFRRTSGYGAYAALGVDYVLSSRWVIGFRTDYTWMKYTELIVGTESSDLDDPIDGSSLGLSLSFHYRVPVWW